MHFIRPSCLVMLLSELTVLLLPSFRSLPAPFSQLLLRQLEKVGRNNDALHALQARQMHDLQVAEQLATKVTSALAGRDNAPEELKSDIGHMLCGIVAAQLQLAEQMASTASVQLASTLNADYQQRRAAKQADAAAEVLKWLAVPYDEQTECAVQQHPLLRFFSERLPPAYVWILLLQLARK
jgi:hypothetical protein